MSGASKEFGSQSAEDFLGTDQYSAVVLAPARDIEQSEQNPLRADAESIIEVPGYAIAAEDSGHCRAIDLRELSAAPVRPRVRARRHGG